MKTSCKVVGDLLPMYCDGVCSEDSAALIDEHLAECPQCRETLASMRGEIVLPKATADDLRPLEAIHSQWKKEKKRSVQKGACITLVIVLVVLAVWTGIWYFGYARYYDRLAGELEKVSGDTAQMTTAGYYGVLGKYCVVLKKPGFLGEGGFIHVGDKEGMVIFLDEDFNTVGQNKDIWIDLFFYPNFGGGWKFALIMDDGNRSWWVWLTPEMTIDWETYDDLERMKMETANLQQMLENHRSEITGLFDVVYQLWGIKYLRES